MIRVPLPAVATFCYTPSPVPPGGLAWGAYSRPDLPPAGWRTGTEAGPDSQRRGNAGRFGEGDNPVSILLLR